MKTLPAETEFGVVEVVPKKTWRLTGRSGYNSYWGAARRRARFGEIHQDTARWRRLYELSRARKARGCDLASDLFVETRIGGELPGGGKDQTTGRVSSVVAFLVMKGMALFDRLKEKDAWTFTSR